jgi:iron complex transport system permease protein
MDNQSIKSDSSRGRTKLFRHLIVWTIVLVVTCILGVCFGAVTTTNPTIIFEMRLPRVLMAVLVGGALATSGAIYQSIFRNSLADPYLLGVSSGASLGAMLAMIATLALGFRVARWGAVPLAAFVGALATMYLVSRISRARGAQATSLILAGVAISYTLAAITAFAMVMAREQMAAIVYWNMGSLNLASWTFVAILAPVILASALYACTLAPKLDVMLLGEERAGQVGLDAQVFTRTALIVASILTAAAVCTTGLIGFVGLMVPHGVRLRYGALHKALLPLSFLLGAILLVLADLIARVVLAPVEIPVGIVTAVLGGPFFVWMLLRSRKGGNSAHLF